MSASPDQTHSVAVTCPGCFHPRTWEASAACPICHHRVNAEGRSGALLPVGTQLKGYVVGEKLGQGGFGITYRGFDVTLKMKVAIKEYYPSEMVGRSTNHKTVVLSSRDHEETFHYCRQAFLSEAQTVAQIRHPHIVRVLNYFELNGTAYLVMDYYNGEDLERHLRLNRKDQPSRKLPWREAVTLLLPVLDGLQKVHQAGFMHRDIKPGNLYLTEDGLILLDFGSARQVTGTHTGSLLIFSQGYSPYEHYIEGQLNRQGPWTDIYAVAATLYVMLTAHRLPSGLDRIQAQLRNQPEVLKPARFFVSDIPIALDQALQRALAVEPDQRTPSVAQFKQELKAVLAEVEKPLPQPVPEPDVNPESPLKPSPKPKVDPEPLPQPPPKQEKKPFHWRAAAFTIMVISLVAGGGWWFGLRVPPNLPKSLNLPVAPVAVTPPVPVTPTLPVVETPAPVIKATLPPPVAEPAMIKITSGCFQMGSPSWESGRDSDEKQHQVCVEGFEMGRYEVTQQEWQAVMGNNPSHFSGCADCPVDNVSWTDVQDYLAGLNQKTGQSYRLPTEAEWEYACRGGRVEDRYCGGHDSDRLAWHYRNNDSKMHPVGQKEPNGFGLYDMSGNVWEWTCSAYDKNYGGAEQKCANSDTGDPLAVRGGSWLSEPAGVRSAYRFRNTPAYHSLDQGFRLARSL